jgi:hypothetical protein
MSLPEILKEVDNLDNETREFKYELTKLAWYMRGGVTLSEIYASSPEDREQMSKLVRENLETTKKTKMPFF